MTAAYSERLDYVICCMYLCLWMLYEGDMAIFIEIGCGSFYLVKIKLLSVSKFHTTLPMDMCILIQ